MRTLTIKDSDFEAQQPKNQAYFESLESLVISGSEFKDTYISGSASEEARALEGAGIYAKNLYKLHIKDCSIE